MGWFGLGKRRTRLGKFLDDYGITQLELAKMSGVHRNTLSRICNEDFTPTISTARKIIRALRQYDSEISIEDFWDV